MTGNKPDTPRLIAKTVKLTVRYDGRRNQSEIVADYGDWHWIAGPFGGDYRGKQYTMWNKHRDCFKGESLDVRDVLPDVVEP